MTKRLRNEEEERESPSQHWPEAKKQVRTDDDVGEDILAWLLLDDDDCGANGGELFCGTGGGTAAVAARDELAELLAGAEKGEASAAMKVRFTEHPYRSSSASAESVFRTAAASSSYVTINGNEETCGSSFSDWDSSVMASVDIGGLGGGSCCFGFEAEPPAGDLGGACRSRAEDGCGEGVDWGFDWEGDEEALARFMDEVFSEQSSLA